jgi:hypothetical protein
MSDRYDQSLDGIPHGNPLSPEDVAAPPPGARTPEPRVKCPDCGKGFLYEVCSYAECDRYMQVRAVSPVAGAAGDKELVSHVLAWGAAQDDGPASVRVIANGMLLKAIERYHAALCPPPSQETP